jgi:aminomethyltransferase
MASKRAANMLRPVFNGLKIPSTTLQQASSSRISARSISVQASRPRKLTRSAQQPVRHASSAAKGEELGKTSLYELHAKYGAKFVPFGGYSMPVQYSDLGIVDSHHWTREKASLFDVGHMYVSWTSSKSEFSH